MIKRSRRIIILVSLILVLLVGLTYTWSVEKKEANLNTITLQTLEDGSMQLSTRADGGWGEDLTIEYDVSELTDVSGDGYDFYVPILDPITKQPVYGGSTEWNTAAEGTNYITFDVYVRSSNNMYIYLDSESSIQPNATIRSVSETYNANQIANKSAYGDFTKDYIAAASRFAAYSSKINVDDNATSLKDTMNLEYIWVPNSTYELYTSEDNELLFTENGNLEYEYYYLDQEGHGVIEEYDGVSVPENCEDATHRSYVTQQKSGNDISYELALLDSELIKTEIKADVTNPNGDAPIAKLEGLNGELGITKMSFSFWIDGNDREASVTLAGGVVDIDLFFSGIELQAGPISVSYANGYLTGVTTEMEYSLDNGETYQTFTQDEISTAGFDVSRVITDDLDYYNNQILVRYISLGTNNLPSSYVEIDIP